MEATTLSHSFETIYRRSYGTIFRFAKRLCRSVEDAEDVTQEAFSRAFAAIGSFKHDRPIENWLMRITHNTFLDLKRKQRRRPSTVQESALADDRGLESIVDSGMNPEQQLLRSEIPESLRESLNHVEPDSRELLILAHVEQLSYSEIAEKTGLKLATVRSRLHRACRKVRRMAMSLEQKKEALFRVAVA